MSFLATSQSLTINEQTTGQVVCRAGPTTLYQYDRLGRLTQITDPLAQTTQHSWDAHDNLLSLTDAAGNTHRFEYSKVGQLLKETRPLGGSIEYSYNAAGYLIQRTDAANNTRSYRYDAAGRLIEEEHTLPDSTRDQLSQYVYNKDGQLTGYEQTDGSNQLISSAIYELDQQGRTKASTTTYGKTNTADRFSFTTGQSFNADGQLESHTYPDGSQQKYSYHHGQLSSITLPNQREISYNDYHWVMPTRITGPGTHKDITYDALLRPTGITVTNQQTPPQTLAQRLYQYDTAGNISQIQSDLGMTDYGYDKLDRLTQASPNTALQTLGLPQEQYSYDPVGNRTSSAHQPGFWRYNADNQLTEYPSLKPFSLGALPVDTAVSYTPHGHTQKETNRLGTKEYSYNAAERLIRFSNTLAGQDTADVQANYRYDPFGRRIAKTVTQGSQTGTVWFIYSEQGLMAEASAEGELTKAYGFNPTTGQQGMWSTDPVWQANITNNQLDHEHTAYHYLHTDHLYTPMLATDETGDISWKAIQEAFGAVSVQQHQSRINMNLRFPGQYYDQETGTHYNFHRDYKPNAGRYVQSDPIGLEGGVNLYGYVESSPVTQLDPEGLIVWTGNHIRFDLIVGVGLSFSMIELTSECVDGKQAKVGVVAVGPGLGFGLGTPTFSAGNACFEDRLPNVDPYVFNGVYSSYYAGFTAIVYGAGLEVAVLGNAGNCNLFGHGLSFGLSAGYSYVLGSSTVRSVDWRECGCE